MIGILVIGQSPRPKLEEEFRRVMPTGIKIRLEGILDSLSTEERCSVRAKLDEDTLFAVMPDGSDIRLSHAAISKIALSRLQALAAEGCSPVLFCCTGEFPELHVQPFLLPAPILTKAVTAVVRSGHLGVFAPLLEQTDVIKERWCAAGVGMVSTIALAPNAAEANIMDAARQMTEKTPDYVVYDCMSYSHALRRQADSVIGRPSILSVSLVARVLAELVDGQVYNPT